MASTKLTMSNSGAGDSRKKMTWSFWIKRSKLGATQYLYNQYYSSDQYNSGICFQSADKFRFWDYAGSSNDIDLQTTRLFRDVNAWFHIVLAIDTTQGTAANRVKLYVNGVQETSFSTETYPSQNHQLRMGEGGSSHQQQIGFQGFGSTYQSYFDGVMSHVHYIDGTQYAASTFGSTDATTGEWEINTSPSVTYGTNGFFILKDGNSVTDASPNSNNFTVGAGTLTKTEDCPSNVFATLDKIQYKTSALTYSNGNTTVSFPGAWVFALSQWGVSSGKWYWEAKCNSGNNANSFYGICSEMVPAGNGFYNNSQNGAIMYKVGSGETYIDGTNNASGYSPSINDTDIVGLALDLDSGTKTLKIYKNGTLLSSGGTINLSSHYNNTLVFPCFSGNSSSASCSFNVNFGNGYFGTTAVSSAGTNASDNGIFEYDVPTGFTALSTKGLNL